MQYSFAAKESVGYYATWTLSSPDGTPLDLTGWTFKATFGRTVNDPAAINLGMAADEAAQGFRVYNAQACQITCRILPATLQGYPDSTGNFDLIGDLLATPPGSDRFSVCDLILTIIKGPTT